MFGIRFRRVVAVSALVFVALATAQPVFADEELGERGTVGQHSLTDTFSNPGARCKYREMSDPDDVGRLRRIVVRPPNMRAVAGKDDQMVGWQFTVQRRITHGRDPRFWEKRYISPTYTATTDDAHDAPFSEASVRVYVPFTEPGSGHGYAEYRVNVTMFWYRADGSVQGMAKHRVEFYQMVMDTRARGAETDTCPDFYLLHPA